MVEIIKPKLMGVLNVTPDSFSDGGKHNTRQAAADHARLLLMAGADIIDIGGESTRPGAERVSIIEEIARVYLVMESIRDEVAASGATMSIDTMNAETAMVAVDAGATIINDVSGGLADPKMFEVAAKTGATIVISHWRGFSSEMDKLDHYLDVAREVASELKVRIDAALAAGIARDKIVIDPGLGFAKNMEQNWKLVARLDEIEQLGFPVLVGASRKRFIAGALDDELDDDPTISNERRDVATAVLTALLLQRNLWGVRVHNVLSTNDAIAVVTALKAAQ